VLEAWAWGFAVLILVLFCCRCGRVSALSVLGGVAAAGTDVVPCVAHCCSHCCCYCCYYQALLIMLLLLLLLPSPIAACTADAGDCGCVCGDAPAGEVSVYHNCTHIRSLRKAAASTTAAGAMTSGGS